MEAASLGVERGLFLWHKLFTTDPNAAMDFYMTVVNVEEPEDGGEAEDSQDWLAQGIPVASVEFSDSIDEHFPSRWEPYIQTPDLDETMALADRIADVVFEETWEEDDLGRVTGLVVHGTLMWIVEPESDGPMPKRPALGAFGWNELPALYPLGALGVYRELFGWEVLDEVYLGDDHRYYVFGKGNAAFGAIHDIGASDDDVEVWVPYVGVVDLDASIYQVGLRGGQVLTGPKEGYEGRRVATCLDPYGAAFGLREEGE